MADYKELREGYQLNRGISSTSGTRVFIDYTGGSDSLPELGDPFSVDYLAVTCQNILEEEYHFESGACKYKYTCSYSSREQSTTTPVDKDDADNFIYSGGSEMVSIEDPKDWYWLPRPWSDDATGELYKGRMYKNTVRGTMSKTMLMDVTDFAAYFTAQLVTKVGKINASSFEGFNIGTVLFTNFDARVVRDNDGTKQYEVTVNFAYRILQVKEGGGSFGSDGSGNDMGWSWNFYLNPNKGSPGNDVWQMVTQTKGTGSGSPDLDNDMVYRSADFSGIIV